MKRIGEKKRKKRRKKKAPEVWETTSSSRCLVRQWIHAPRRLSHIFFKKVLALFPPGNLDTISSGPLHLAVLRPLEYFHIPFVKEAPLARGNQDIILRTPLSGTHLFGACVAR